MGVKWALLVCLFLVCMSQLLVRKVSQSLAFHAALEGCVCWGKAHLPTCARSWSCRGPVPGRTLPHGNPRWSYTACTAGPKRLGEGGRGEERLTTLSSKTPAHPCMSQYQHQVSRPRPFRFVFHVLLGSGRRYFQSVRCPRSTSTPLTERSIPAPQVLSQSPALARFSFHSVLVRRIS